ncbi:alpha/beta hydrolase [Streptomyces sp. W16]|uniref:alpha/beta fold hydrolase n=1 Tax=Streptomyces sp. W16 TaxID=3076631 RepID=UPI00295A75A2|nr:alpha/beta hydrolase [Streptomyces sp. W16]MDV9173853.1 alpha/beta hydrolase [Streptomyces sp. W16]
MPYFASPVDAARLHYVDYGPADGPVLFFVNSAYLGAEMWEFQMLPLAAEGYRCVGFDRRGHGRSEDTWSGFDLDSLGDDLHGLLELLDLREVTLVGHSMGSVEIVRCLTRHGAGRVARVAFVGGIAPGVVRSADHPDGLDPDVVRGLNEECRRDRAAFFTDGVDAFFAVDRPGNDVSASYRQYIVDRALISTAHSTAAVQALIALVDVAPELPELGVPVLVVHGTHDTSAPLELTARRTARLVPDGTLKIYDGAGHGLFVTHADQLNEDLREFAK